MVRVWLHPSHLSQHFIAHNTVLDFSFWSKEERALYRKKGEKAGARVQLYWLDAPDEVWEREGGGERKRVRMSMFQAHFLL